MKINKKFLLVYVLAITSNACGMEKEANQNAIDYNSVPFDVVAGLEENNKLLRDIKRQNRAIIKQNYLNSQIQTLHTELCSPRTTAYSCSEKDKLHEKYKLASKMKEIYLGEKLIDLSWSISDEDK